MTRVPAIDFIFRENGEFVTRSSAELFGGKRVVLFSLPGAFTPTCSTYQLPGYDEKYQEFKDLGIDEVYCISVNDAFVMNAWSKELNIEHVKLIPDGNARFTSSINQLVEKSNLGFGWRSWRYAAVVNDGVVEMMFEEAGKVGNCPTDPYEVSDPDTVLKYLRSNFVK